MKRVLINFLLTLSSLFALTSLILLPLSHRHRLFIGWQRLEQGPPPDNHSIELFVTNGSLALEVWARDTFWLSTIQLSPPDWWDRKGFYAGTARPFPVSAYSPPSSFDRLGFHFHHESSHDQPRTRQNYIIQHTVIALPLWLLFLLTATPPTLAILRRRRARRHTQSKHCLQCGYDLRATPDRCPECGRLSAPAQAS